MARALDSELHFRALSTPACTSGARYMAFFSSRLVPEASGRGAGAPPTPHPEPYLLGF